jgi:hypothetical protein
LFASSGYAKIDRIGLCNACRTLVFATLARLVVWLGVGRCYQLRVASLINRQRLLRTGGLLVCEAISGNSRKLSRILSQHSNRNRRFNRIRGKERRGGRSIFGPWSKGTVATVIYTAGRCFAVRRVMAPNAKLPQRQLRSIPPLFLPPEPLARALKTVDSTSGPNEIVAA